MDGGSTGSRLHVFEQVEDALERRGSSKTHLPLSAFAPKSAGESLNATEIAVHMLPAFDYAANIVPEHLQSLTPVYYQATAGMRLLSAQDQADVYDALYEGLMEAPSFRFSLQRPNIQTLSGELEALYGAMAANYLTRTVDSHLVWKTNHTGATSEAEPVGSLDMGGSSTQIVFRPDSSTQTCEITPNGEQICSGQEDIARSAVLNDEHFFATSYLSYGVDKLRERLWTTWVEKHKGESRVENPCAFVDNVQEWQGHNLVGTGDAQACRQEIQKLIAHPTESTDANGTVVAGVEHPRVTGKFLAMSMFFYGLDSLRLWATNHPEAHATLNANWPTPTLHELTEALPGLCSRHWDDIRNDENTHQFTRPEILPHRCVESVYMVTLLRDGFGFDPHARDISYTFRVDGSEVEWTLGLALALNRAKRREAQETVDLSGSLSFSDLGQPLRQWVRSLLSTA